MIIQWVHTGVRDEFIHACMQECLHEFMASFDRSSWSIHTGVSAECMHESMQGNLQEFVLSFNRSARWLHTWACSGVCIRVYSVILQEFLLSACNIVCRLMNIQRVHTGGNDECINECTRSVCRSACWVSTECTMNAYMSACRSVYMSSCRDFTGVQDECIQDSV